jgi:transposase
LHLAHKQERNKKYAYRIHAVILLGTGYTLKKVKQVLFIDDETLRSYVDIYRHEGIPGLLADNRGGKCCILSKSQIELLCAELVNLHGAINAETHEITIIESETINAESTITLLSVIERKYSAASAIKVILDNATYHYSAEVKKYVDQSKISLIFLPSYSPNLNLIERLWHFFKKKVIYNTYYKNVDAFRKSCINFFRNIDRYAKEISIFMNAEFHIE